MYDQHLVDILAQIKNDKQVRWWILLRKRRILKHRKSGLRWCKENLKQRALSIEPCDKVNLVKERMLIESRMCGLISIEIISI